MEKVILMAMTQRKLPGNTGSRGDSVAVQYKLQNATILSGGKNLSPRIDERHLVRYFYRPRLVTLGSVRQNCRRSFAVCTRVMSKLILLTYP